MRSQRPGKGGPDAGHPLSSEARWLSHRTGIFFQASRLDLDQPLRVIKFVERQHVEAHAVVKRLHNPLDLVGEIVATQRQQPVPLDLDDPLYSQL